jgi:hypothetical protein
MHHPDGGPAARGLAGLLQQRRQRQGDHGHPAAGLGGVRMTHQPLYLLVVVPEDKRSEHKHSIRTSLLTDLIGFDPCI